MVGTHRGSCKCINIEFLHRQWPVCTDLYSQAARRRERPRLNREGHRLKGFFLLHLQDCISCAVVNISCRGKRKGRGPTRIEALNASGKSAGSLYSKDHRVQLASTSC